MKELVRRHRGNGIQVLTQPVSVHVNRRTVGVLHAPARGPVRKVIEECVLVERPVLHPVDFGMGNLLQHAVQLRHVIVSRIPVYHNVVGRSILLK